MSFIAELPRSPLLLRIVGLRPVWCDPAEPRRVMPRQRPPGVCLAMRRFDGPVRAVRLHDASKIGLSVICREVLEPGEVVGLRMDDGTGPYERFRVIHIMKDADAYRVGMIASP